MGGEGVDEGVSAAGAESGAGLSVAGRTEVSCVDGGV